MDVGSDGRLPAVFISHGAPTLATDDGPAHRFLSGYGERLGRPTAILVMSAHHLAPVATLTTSERPGTIHDFGGFSRALQRMQYPAPGDPALANRAARLIEAGGLPVRLDADRGLDHGAWVPLSLMYPRADVPVVSLSVNPRRDAETHYRLGQLLEPLRDDGVLILGSGGATHNLRELRYGGTPGETPSWAASFNEWLAEGIADHRLGDLLAWQERGPDAARNHPTDEHYLPLPFALGAANGEARHRRVHHSYTYEALSMDVYEFGLPAAVSRAA